MTAFTPTISFSPIWQTLGPFQIGTREATWGADPLEAFGGFHCFSCNENSIFPSSLATNGTVAWSTLIASISSPAPTSTRADLLVGFENTDWDFLKSVYGWAALQYQGWTRGSLMVHGNKGRKVVLYTDNILEFWVDDERYFGGDFYSYRRAPLVLQLEPGEHIIEVRIVRDVRAMGGVGKPTVSLMLEAELSEGRPRIVEGGLVLPDMVEGRLSSSLGSVTVRNEGDAWIGVVGIEAMNVCFFTIPSSTLSIFPQKDR